MYWLGAITFGSLGLVFGAAFNESPYQELRTECEKTLPRNEHCIIVAQPAPKELNEIIEEGDK